MSAEQAGGGPAGPGEQPSEEELRAAYEAEIKKLRVEHIVLDQVVTLINLGMRRTGLAPGTEDERDIAQVRVAIDAVRALLPLIEEAAGPQLSQIRDALSQLQLAYVKLGGSPAPAVGQDPGVGGRGASPGEGPASPGTAPPPPAPGESKPGESGPAQRSGRLWIPGQ